MLQVDSGPAVVRTEIPGIPVRRGKARDVYDLGDSILLVATDRISAYDVVLPTPIPGKGRLLTQISRKWFELLSPTVEHHLIEVLDDHVPDRLAGHADELRGRSMLCKKCEVIPIEFVVRGYLAGSGYQEYQQGGTVCGVPLPKGLRMADRLPAPIFTPATKVDVGHDENITFERACELVGAPLMERLRDASLRIYSFAADYAAQRGIIIADTKFEWGRWGDKLLLIDEVLTPDSSRFWPADTYQPGSDPPSFDKQYVRNYLTDLCRQGLWNKLPPGPELPREVVEGTRQRYEEARRRLCES